MYIVCCVIIVLSQTLMTINQYLLDSVGVGHPSINSVIAAAEKYNFPTKLTGAGGGGCVISLLPNDVKSSDVSEFEAACAKLGYETFECMIGQSGALVHHQSLDDLWKSKAEFAAANASASTSSSS
jgi:mevalonate kinase